MTSKIDEIKKCGDSDDALDKPGTMVVLKIFKGDQGLICFFLFE